MEIEFSLHKDDIYLCIGMKVELQKAQIFKKYVCDVGHLKPIYEHVIIFFCRYN